MRRTRTISQETPRLGALAKRLARILGMAACLSMGGLALPSFADITIAAGGDVMTGDDVNFNVFANMGPEAADILRAADYAFVNLEGPIGGIPGTGKQCKTGNCFAFRQNPDTALMLARSGVDAVATANNHAMDMGISGVDSTIEKLKEAGIVHSGYALDEVPVKNVKGLKIGLIAFSANTFVNDFRNPTTFSKAVMDAKKKCDFLIVSMHMGAEGRSQAILVTDREEMFLGENRGNPYMDARLAIDSGADLVIGHGPHVPRGADVYRNKLILYSLGNFLSGKGISVKDISGVAPLVTISYTDKGKLKSYRVDSFTQDQRTQYPDRTERANKVMKSISHPSALAYCENCIWAPGERNLYEERLKSASSQKAALPDYPNGSSYQGGEASMGGGLDSNSAASMDNMGNMGNMGSMGMDGGQSLGGIPSRGAEAPAPRSGNPYETGDGMYEPAMPSGPYAPN